MGYSIPYGERNRRNEMFAKGYLWCNHCKQFQPVERFNKNKRERSNYGYRYYCGPCEWARRDKEKTRVEAKKRNTELKKKFVDLAGGCCQRCGYNEFLSGLDFHHVYPDDKDQNPNYVIYNGDFEKAWVELDKCCLLCACCHNGYEANEWKVEFIKRDGLGWKVGDSLPLNDTRYQAEPEEEIAESPIPIEYLPSKPKQLQLLEGKAVYQV